MGVNGNGYVYRPMSAEQVDALEDIWSAVLKFRKEVGVSELSDLTTEHIAELHKRPDWLEAKERFAALSLSRQKK